MLSAAHQLFCVHDMRQITVKQQALTECLKMLICIDTGQLFCRMHPASQYLIAAEQSKPAAVAR